MSRHKSVSALKWQIQMKGKENDDDKRQTNNDWSADYDAWALTNATYDERCEEENVIYPR